MKMSEVKRKTVFITGASSGIGEALAREYARRGWNVGVLARREPLLQTLVDSLRSSHPNQSFSYAASDIADEIAQFRGLEQLISTLGCPQVFIANSGYGKGVSPRQPMWDNTRKTFMINVVGTIAGLEYIKEYWIRENQPGHLVGISSVAAGRGLPGTAAYSSSKAALATYLESVRGDLAKAGILVTCVHPGFVRTPMTETNPWMPWLLEPQDAARRIADAIERNRRRFVFPFPMKFVFWLLRHMPDGLYDWLSRRARSHKKLD